MEADVRRQQEELFERMPVPRAVMKLVLPTIAASLVTVLYSLAIPILSACSNSRFRRLR